MKKFLIKNSYIIFFVLIIISWIPTFVAFCPVILNYDGAIQIYGYVIKGCSPSTKQPIISTILFSTFYKMGIKFFNSATIGMMFFSLFQIIIMSGIFAYTTYFIYNETKSKKLAIISLIFYALFPFNQLFPLMTTKDVLFSGLALIFTINLYKFSKKEYKIKEYIFFVIITIFMLLFRNNAVYAFIVMIPIVIIILKKDKKKIKDFIILSIIIILIYEMIFNLLIVLVNGEKDDDREKMSVISQAIARVANKKNNELNEEDRRKIIYYFGDIENLSKVYNDTISDPTKAIINIGRVNENKKEFYTFFVQLGMEYPKVYLESFIQTTKNYWILQDLFSVNELDGKDLELSSNKFKFENNEIYTINYYNILPKYRYFLIKMFEKNYYRKIPIIHIIFQPAIYFYILLICIVISIKNKNIKLQIALTYLFLYYMTCFFGPCSITRYVYINIIAMPLIISLLQIKELKKKED